MTKNGVLRACLMFGVMLMCMNQALSSHVKTATAISEVFGDGVKVTAAILLYDQEIDGKSLSVNTFRVEGREIAEVYASQVAEPGSKAVSGSYVMVVLKSATEFIPLATEETHGWIQGPVAGQKGMGPMGENGRPKRTVVDTVSLTQVLPLQNIRGERIDPSGERIVAKTARTLVVDDFEQYIYSDKETGIDLAYNLYIPENRDLSKKYPLVLFIHDASGAAKETRNPLLQGNGATIWATPESQAKHPCFVLAPQFARVTVDDDFNTTEDLDACLRLLDDLITRYDIDTDRIYTTGQSMGCMSSYVLMLRRPDLFASAMLVAGQWDPSVMAPLAKKNLWLLSCTGDIKSSEGVAQAMEVWSKNGGAVMVGEYPFESTAEDDEREVQNMLRRGGNIHYTHFTGGSHNNTWRKAYYIEGIRDWLFAQHQPLKPDSVVRLLRNVEDQTVLVAANHGDFHGTTENSVRAIEKAVQKGAVIALVDVREENGELLLDSGDKLEEAIEAVRDQILLLVNPASGDVARSLEKFADDKNARSQFILYGSNYGTSLDYMARIHLDQDAATIEDVLAAHPIAVELTFSDENNPSLAIAIERIKSRARICFNTTAAGLSGSRSDDSVRGDEQRKMWSDLIDRGGTIILTNQIKPLLNWRNSL